MKEFFLLPNNNLNAKRGKSFKRQVIITKDKQSKSARDSKNLKCQLSWQPLKYFTKMTSTFGRIILIRVISLSISATLLLIRNYHSIKWKLYVNSILSHSIAIPRSPIMLFLQSASKICSISTIASPTRGIVTQHLRGTRVIKTLLTLTEMLL